MSWVDIVIAPAGTHHLTRGQALYTARFDEVLAFHAPGLAPVQRGGEGWHIDVEGRPAYERRHRRTFGFYEGLATVEGPGGWHHILPGGEDAYLGRHAWCGNYQGGRCTVRDIDGRYRHLDSAGQPAYAERWRYAGDYRDGIAVVQEDDGLSTHVDAWGALVHGRWLLDLDVFHKGYARARDGDGWMHVTRKGEPAYRRRFAAVEPFYNGQAHIERFDGALEVIDEQGNALIELRPPRRSDFAALSADLVGFWRTRTIATAVDLGVIEELPGTSEAIADGCGLRPGPTGRLLRALGELRLVERQGAVWSLTTRGRHLRGDDALTLADAAREYAGAFTRLWSELPEALRIGGSWSPPDIFGDVARDPGRVSGHHRMLRSYARHDYAAVPAALGLRGNELVIDAGGGCGTLAGLLLEHYPELRVVLIDRSEVVANVVIPQGLGSRLTVRAADFHEPWGCRADAVVLARVLHDWDDGAAELLLIHARAALPRGGRLFAIEMVLDEKSTSGGLCDLHLLMVTGGRERTRADYERLFRATGFEVTDVVVLPALPSVIVAVAR